MENRRKVGQKLEQKAATRECVGDIQWMGTDTSKMTITKEEMVFIYVCLCVCLLSCR